MIRAHAFAIGLSGYWQPVMPTRCVLSGSCPQFLDAPLRTSQRPVDREGVGVGCYFGRDPGSQSHEGGRERLAQAEYPLQAGDGDLHSLPDPTPPRGWLRHQKDVHLGQGLLQPLASVGQIPQEPPRYSIPKAASARSSSLKETSAMLAGVRS